MLCVAVNAVPFANDSQGSEFTGKTWVVLCAGWKGYYGSGYSIQANVYKAYQVFHAQGIPDENIIVMHYDDLANNKANPTPGKVVFTPNGSDVYHGVPKDYIGKDVTPKNFLSVLKGDPELVKQDMVSFPHGILYGEELVAALKSMHQNKRFAKLVFYLEACESGSMFKLLPKDINIYAITSSNATELSNECNWDESRKVYLGGYFAYRWLDDCEHFDMRQESLNTQFEHMQKLLLIDSGIPNREPHPQHPVQFGDMSITKLSASDANEVDALYNEEMLRQSVEKQYVDKHMTDYVNSIQHLLTVDSNAILNTKQELNNR
ncbi:unnamed protein product, partial [Medioppia subpectinata]